MAPQLFARQLQHGAWGITAATPTQVAVMRRFGINRILLANELTEPGALRWLATQMATDPDFEFFHLVDSPATVQATNTILQSVDPPVTMPVLLEVGVPGGRTGARSVDDALTVARQVAKADRLTLVGVEAYEGLAAGGGSTNDLDVIDRYLRTVRHVVGRLSTEGLFDATTVIVTAGGSSYFDHVIADLGDWDDLALDVQLVPIPFN